MGIVSKTSIKFSIILYIGIALGYLNTVIIFPNILTEEEFGLTRILFAAAALIAQLSQLGVGNILVRFHPHLKNEKTNSTLTVGLLLSFFGIILSGSAILIFQDEIISYYSEKSALFTNYFYLLLPAIISLIAYNLFDGYLRVLYKNSFSAFLNSVLLRVIWLVIVLLYGYDFFDTKTFMHVYVGGQMLVSVIALIYTIGQGNLKLGLSMEADQLSTLRSMSKFGLITVLSGLSLLLINRIDIIMLGSYVGLADVGVYAIALYMSMVIMVPAQSIGRTTTVLVADAFKAKDMDLIRSLYQKTALNQMLLGSMIFILIIINYESLMSFLPAVYRDSFMVFFLLGLGKIIDTGFGVNGAILLNSKFYKVDTILSVLLLVISILLKLYYIPQDGIIGAAMSTALALILFNIAKFVFLLVKLKLNPFTKHYVWVLFILIIPIALINLLPVYNNFWVDVPIKSSIYILIVIPIIYYLKVSPEFNQIIQNALVFIGVLKKNEH